MVTAARDETDILPSVVPRFLSNGSLPSLVLSEKVSFNRINRKTGNRLKQQNVDPETGGGPAEGHCARV